MKLRRLSPSLLAGMTVVLLVGWTATLTGTHQKAKVGKKAEIHLTTEIQVGPMTLPPGDYQVEGRMEGLDHHVEFTPLRGTRALTEPGDVRCLLERLPTKAPQTVDFTETRGSVTRLTRLEVEGEMVAYVF